MRIAIALCMISSLLATDGALALGSLRFGPEFTFSESDGSNDKFKLVAARMTRHLVQEQPEGQKFVVDRKTYSSPNGWWFEWSQEGSRSEVGMSMEFTMFPATVEYFRQFKDDMHDAIFASATNEGLFPSMFRGGGHINVSTRAMDSNLLLRNFLVDLMNHNELFMGVFGYDTNNALPFALIPEEAKLAVRAVLRKFDQGEYATKATRDKFINDLTSARAIVPDPFLRFWGKDKDQRLKHFDVNYGHMKEERRLEIRGVRPQTSMDMWVRQIDLLERRIKHLDTIRRPIPLLLEVPFQTAAVPTEENHLQPPVDPQLALRAFYKYVSESGAKWQDHTDYLWPKWVADGEVTKFEKSQWFLQREGKTRRACASNLLKVAG